MALGFIYRPFFVEADERSVGAHDVRGRRRFLGAIHVSPLPQINISQATLHSLVDTVVSYVHGLEEPHMRYKSLTPEELAELEELEAAGSVAHSEL